MKKLLLLLTVLTPVAVAAACSARPDAEPRTASSFEAITTNVPILSTTTCAQRAGHLVSCAIPTQTLAGTQIDTAVPLRTTFTAKRTGNCSTQYPLEVTFTTGSEAPVKYQFLSTASVAVRRADGLAITAITVSDSSPWTKFASFDASCSLSLDVAFNEVDVDSKDQAQALLTNLQNIAAQKASIRDHDHDLVLYQSAYDLMSAVAQSFYVELTNDTMQQLRSSANDASDALLTLITTCDAGLTPDDKKNLAHLYAALPVLGTNDAFLNADGGTKTLADYLGPSAAGVLATVNKLSHDHGADAGLDASSYQSDYQQAAKDAAEADAQVALAKSQLAPWLGP